MFGIILKTCFGNQIGSLSWLLEHSGILMSSYIDVFSLFLPVTPSRHKRQDTLLLVLHLRPHILKCQNREEGLHPRYVWGWCPQKQLSLLTTLYRPSVLLHSAFLSKTVGGVRIHFPFTDCLPFLCGHCVSGLFLWQFPRLLL